MIKNTRLFKAVHVLSTMEGDVRARVVVAMREISVLGKHEFIDESLWKRIQKLKSLTTHKGSLTINGNLIKDALENTADNSRNSTYKKHAEEIFSIWFDELNS